MSRAHSESVTSQFDEFVSRAGGDLALPGSGSTWRRFESFARLASLDLSLARLCEGHADALAILAEADMKPVDADASYGVWASRGSRATTTASRTSNGWQLSGRKEFCSGNQLVSRALVTAETTSGYLLFDVSVVDQVVSTDESSWPTVGMADSNSQTVEFGGPAIGDDQVVGGADFYTRRPGFWFGAAGVAACWYGGALGLVNELVESLGSEPGELVAADLGYAVGLTESMRLVLTSVAQAIDEDPSDATGEAQLRALVARQMVHDGATQVLARVAAAGGARPLCHNGAQSRRAADLYIYLAQHHGGADAAALGRLRLGSSS